MMRHYRVEFVTVDTLRSLIDHQNDYDTIVTSVGLDGPHFCKWLRHCVVTPSGVFAPTIRKAAIKSTKITTTDSLAVRGRPAVMVNWLLFGCLNAPDLAQILPR